MANKILTVLGLKKKIYAEKNSVDESSVSNSQAASVTVDIDKTDNACVTKSDVEADGVSEDYEISAPSGYEDSQLIPDVTLAAGGEISIQDNISVHYVDEDGSTVQSDTVVVHDSHAMKVPSSFVKNYPSDSSTSATDWLNYFKINKLYYKIVSQFKETHASDISTADVAAPTIDGYTLSTSSSNEAHNAGVLNNLDGSRTPIFANSYSVTHKYAKKEETYKLIVKPMYANNGSLSQNKNAATVLAGVNTIGSEYNTIQFEFNISLQTASGGSPSFDVNDFYVSVKLLFIHRYTPTFFNATIPCSYSKESGYVSASKSVSFSSNGSTYETFVAYAFDGKLYLIWVFDGGKINARTSRHDTDLLIGYANYSESYDPSSFSLYDSDTGMGLINAGEFAIKAYIKTTDSRFTESEAWVIGEVDAQPSGDYGSMGGSFTKEIDYRTVWPEYLKRSFN